MTEAKARVPYENLEALIDELIKDKPSEPKVKQCMEAAGLSYTTDSVHRMSLVLAKMDHLKDATGKDAGKNRSAKSIRNDQSAN